MRATTPRLVLASAALFVCVGAQANTYFVSPSGLDSNPGTQTKPLATISGSMYKVQPGDTVILVAGTYRWTSAQSLRGVGTATQHIIIKGASGAVVDGSTILSFDTLVISGQYLDVSNIAVKNSTKNGFSVWGAKHVTISNCLATNSKQSGILVTNGAQDVTVQSCEIVGNMQGNASRTSSNWSPAVFAAKASGITISGNYVHENYGEGIDACLVDTCAVTSNVVRDNYSANVLIDTSTNVLVDSNLIYSSVNGSGFYRIGNPAIGIAMDDETYVSLGPVAALPSITNYCTISNNVVESCMSGFRYLDVSSASSTYFADGLQHCIVRNNLFHNTPTHGGLIWIDINPYSTGNLMSYNIVWQQSGRIPVRVPSTSGYSFQSNCWVGGAPAAVGSSTDVKVVPNISGIGKFTAGQYVVSSPTGFGPQTTVGSVGPFGSK